MGGIHPLLFICRQNISPTKKISAPHRNRFNNTIQKERWIFLPALSDVATFRNWILVWISSKCLSRDIFNERKLTKAFDWYQFISCNCSKSIQTKRWNESVCKIGSNNFQVGINTYRHFHHFPSLIALYFRRCRLFLPKSLCSQTFGDHYRIRINCKKKKIGMYDYKNKYRLDILTFNLKEIDYITKCSLRNSISCGSS